MTKPPGIEQLHEAHQRIKPFINKTPVLKSQSINEMLGINVLFKCENFQKVGAFKYRGATNAVQLLSDQEASNGVATHSSGNHAAALALAAKTRGIPAYIVMPRTAPEIKKKAVASYGAEITFCEPTLEAREATLKKIVEKTGANFIHPYNRYDIITGQSTAALELLETQPTLDCILAPVGGGGLLSGTALAAKYTNSKIKVYAGEPELANDAYKSFKSGKLMPPNPPKSIADGLLTSLGDKTFDVIQHFVDDIFTVNENEIISAMRVVWERMKIIIEPSSAVPLAVLFKHKSNFKEKKVGIIISGGNVDLSRLPF